MNRSHESIRKMDNFRTGIALTALVGGLFAYEACKDSIIKKLYEIVYGDTPADTSKPAMAPDELKKRQQDLIDYLEGRTDCLGELECGEKAKAAQPQPGR